MIFFGFILVDYQTGLWRKYLVIGDWSQSRICPASADSVDPDQFPTDLDLHCLPLSIWICVNKMDQVIWLAEKLEVGVTS